MAQIMISGQSLSNKCLQPQNCPLCWLSPSAVLGRRGKDSSGLVLKSVFTSVGSALGLAASPGACWLCACPTPVSPPGLGTLPLSSHRPRAAGCQCKQSNRQSWCASRAPTWKNEASFFQAWSRLHLIQGNI